MGRLLLYRCRLLVDIANNDSLTLKKSIQHTGAKKIHSTHRVFHADRLKRNRHCSASRNDKTNLKKVLWSLNSPIFYSSKFTFTKWLFWGLHKRESKFWNCEMTFLKNPGCDHSVFFNAISMPLESWYWSHFEAYFV